MSERFLGASSSTHHKIYKDNYRLEEDEEDQDYSSRKNFSYFPPPSYTSCRDVILYFILRTILSSLLNRTIVDADFMDKSRHYEFSEIHYN